MALSFGGGLEVKCLARVPLETLDPAGSLPRAARLQTRVVADLTACSPSSRLWRCSWFFPLLFASRVREAWPCYAGEASFPGGLCFGRCADCGEADFSSSGLVLRGFVDIRFSFFQDWTRFLQDWTRFLIRKRFPGSFLLPAARVDAFFALQERCLPPPYRRRCFRPRMEFRMTWNLRTATRVPVRRGASTIARVCFSRPTDAPRARARSLGRSSLLPSYPAVRVFFLNVFCLPWLVSGHLLCGLSFLGPAVRAGRTPSAWFSQQIFSLARRSAPFVRVVYILYYKRALR
ncbi:hypothetical protein EJB05_12538, partial [Eragrostis curvula]